MSEPVTTERLEQFGEALFGAGKWKQPLARALDINRRTFMRFFDKDPKKRKAIPPNLNERELMAVARRVNRERAERVRELG